MRDLYLALGDSITAGLGATHPKLSFARRVSQFATEKELTKHGVVIAKNGWTTKDVLNATQLLRPATLERTGLITLMTGGNDLRKLLRRQYFPLPGNQISSTQVYRRLQEFGFFMDRLCSFIASKEVPHVVVATVYNPVPQYPLGVKALEALNGISREIATGYNFPVVDIYDEFRDRESYFIEGYRNGRFEDLLSPIRRPIHPNNAGHKQIADVVIARIRQDIRQTRRKKKMRKRN